jgi:hypothetical protein
MAEQQQAPPAAGATTSRKQALEEQAAQLAALYRTLIEPEQVVELRALDVQHRGGRPHTEAGFFDGGHLEEMAKAALDLTSRARGVYFTLNPLNPDLLARRCNRVGWAGVGELSKDKDVVRRRWLMVDVDPVRDSMISASDPEKALAETTARAVRDHLRASGWPDPVFADSGNGFHLLYRVDLPADDGGLVEGVLAALARRFDSDRVKIDRKVFNAARICKLPGTWARKGDDVPQRPHRQACILEGPDV